MSRLTRRYVRLWLAPMRKAFSEMKTGETDAIRGYAVTRIDHLDEYARTDWAINGFAAVMQRLLPHLDLAPLNRVSVKLANGVPLCQRELDAGLAVLSRTEDGLIRVPRQTIRDAVLIEQIGIEMASLGILEAA